MDRKIGPLLLSGLMIGPILGSGVILLPPLAYNKIGNQAIYAWLIMMVLGGFFAMIFAKLSIICPGEGGMTIAIEKAFGKKAKLFSSLLLIVAVMFGPTAVLLTAVEYLIKLKVLESMNTTFISIILVVIAFAILLNDIQKISKIILVLSSAIIVILLISGINLIAINGIKIEPVGEIQVISFGKVVLLLFWAIIGWEIVGNYSESVKNRKKTIVVATIFSLIVISITYLIVALAIQSSSMSNNVSLVDVLYPLFGDFSKGILALLVTGLCFSTYLTIVGALGRLLFSLASEGYLPQLFLKKNDKEIPFVGIGCFIIVHAIILLLTGFNLLDVEKIVSIANGFFMGNAIIGLVSSLKIIDGLAYKISGIILIVSLISILIFSDVSTYFGYIILVLVTIVMSRKSFIQTF